MAGNNFNETIASLFGGMDSFFSSKTVVGEPIQVGDTMILPLVDVSFGMGANASARDKKDGSSGGVGGKISPNAVLVIKNGQIRVIPVGSQDPVTRVMDAVPDIVNRLTGSTGMSDEEMNIVNKTSEEKWEPMGENEQSI